MTIQHPKKEQGKLVHDLIKKTGGLDLNSLYYYYLICDHFKTTCAIALDEQGGVMGFISAFIPPENPSALFVWQAVVDKGHQGKGLSSSLLRFLVQHNAHIKEIQTTIGPSNKASQGLFISFAHKNQWSLTQKNYLTSMELGVGHDPEQLFILKKLNN